MMLFNNLSSLKQAVSQARADAESEARASFPWVRSRGTFLSTLNERREQCRPCPEAECNSWNGTWREIQAMIRDVEANHPHVHVVYISGGYDGAEGYHALWLDDNYEPWASSWNVTIWERRAT